MQTQSALLAAAVRQGVSLEEGRLYYDSHEQHVNYVVASPSIGEEGHLLRADAGVAEVDYVPGRVAVLLHGWGAGCGVWAPALPHLVGGFDATIAFDIPGYGLSSRPKFPGVRCGTEASIHFFARALDQVIAELYFESEVFRKARQRVLIAHSLGAHIASQWLRRTNRPLFHALLLCSPAGVISSPRQPTSANIRGIEGAAAHFIDWCWKRGITPQSIMRRLPKVLAVSALRRYLSWRAPGLAEDEALMRYLAASARMDSSSEKAICTLFKPGLWAHKPLEEILPHLDMPMAFIYGEKDLMDWRDARNVMANIRHPTFLRVLPGAKHSAYRDNARIFAGAVFCGLDAILGDV